MDEKLKSYLEDLNKKVFIKGDIIIVNVEYEYEVPIADCKSHERILHWAWHLTEKTWMTTDVLRKFIEVAAHNAGITL